MKIIQFTILVFLLVGITKTAVAQAPWTAEIRPGINFPTQDLDGTDLTIGFGFEAKISYRLMPHLSAYAGWGWNQFSIKEVNIDDPNISVEETGYTFGIEMILPFGNPPISYFVNAGGVYNHIELENSMTRSVSDTDHGLGWQIGGGIAYEFIENWSLRPELRYRSLSRDIMLENINTNLKLQYIGFGMGLSAKF